MIRTLWRWVARRHAVCVALGKPDALPPPGYRQPVVLVCGDGQPALFGASPDVPSVTDQACYVPVPRVKNLPAVVADLRTLRPGWAGQLSVLLVVNPGEHQDTASLAGRLRAFGHQLALARRGGQALPVTVAGYVPAAHCAAPWFCWEAGQPSPWVLEGASRTDLVAWQRQVTDTTARTARLHAAVQLECAARWLHERVLVHVDARVATCAVMLVAATPQHHPGNLWQQWLHQRTGLVQATTGHAAGPSHWPFPDPVVQQLPVSVRRVPPAVMVALWLFTGGSLLAMGHTAWQSRWLAAPAMVQAQPQPIAPTAHPLRLDSLSLFASGSAQLKPQATQVLVSALLDIRAGQGGLIVVSGHTDATGHPDSNQRLSVARAEAVRDWMQTMGRMPAHCFAVQGFGASQPIASNDTESGRAANRRVDIRLVPEGEACGAFTQEPGQQPVPPVAAHS